VLVLFCCDSSPFENIFVLFAKMEKSLCFIDKLARREIIPNFCNLKGVKAEKAGYFILG